MRSTAEPAASCCFAPEHRACAPHDRRRAARASMRSARATPGGRRCGTRRCPSSSRRSGRCCAPRTPACSPTRSARCSRCGATRTRAHHTSLHHPSAIRHHPSHRSCAAALLTSPWRDARMRRRYTPDEHYLPNVLRQVHRPHARFDLPVLGGVAWMTCASLRRELPAAPRERRTFNSRVRLRSSTSRTTTRTSR